MTFYLWIAIIGGLFLAWGVFVLAMTAESRSADWRSEGNGKGLR